MQDLQQLARGLYLLWEGRWDGYFSLIVILLLCRRLRYLSAALGRVPQEKLRLLNETWKTAFETVLREQPRRLRDLVEDIDSESSHRP